MNKDNLIQNLKHEMERRSDDKLNTFDTNIVAMCSDTLNVLERCIEIPEGATNDDVFNMLTEITDEIERNEPDFYDELSKDKLDELHAYWDVPFEIWREEEGK